MAGAGPESGGMTNESPVLQTDAGARAPGAPGRVSFTIAAPVVMLQEPNSAQAESIRALRTHIMAQHVQEGRRALAICGPTPGVGCTFVATNLAVALSQIGVQTLLVDADLRKGGVSGLIRPSAPVEGLRQSLESGENSFGDYIQHEVLPNLSIMYSGGMAPNAQELLASERFDVLMNYCLRDFEVTILDTPPANSCSDARRVATVAGYAIIATRQDLTRVRDVKTLIEQLTGDRAKIVGTVLNEG